MAVEVLAVGHASYDMSFFSPEFPAENTKIEVRDLLECGGGPAANAAFLLSSWGIKTAFAGLLGDDIYGHKISEEFTVVGTDLTLTQFRKAHPTPLSMIVVSEKNGSRTIINRKAAAPFRLDDSKLRALTPRQLLFDGHELDASLQALESFPNAISILDAGSPREGALELASRVDILAASKRFALATASVPNLDAEQNRRQAILNLRERFEATAIITLGEDGLIADDGSGFRHLPAPKAHPIDTTGAGDIFHGALAFAHLREMKFWDRLKFASTAAALSVQKRGARTSIPTLIQVEEACANG